MFVTGQSDGRWHANHLNAKAEGINCDRLSWNQLAELAKAPTFEPGHSGKSVSQSTF